MWPLTHWAVFQQLKQSLTSDMRVEKRLRRTIYTIHCFRIHLRFEVDPMLECFLVVQRDP